MSSTPTPSRHSARVSLVPTTPAPSRATHERESNTQDPNKTVGKGKVKKGRTKWTTEMEIALLDGLIEAKKEAHDTDNGNFKAAGWKITVNAVQGVTNQLITREICENKWRVYRDMWRLWVKHQNQISGWTWDPDLRTYVNDPEVMDTYFSEHLEMKIFHMKGPPYDEKLEELLENKV